METTGEINNASARRSKLTHPTREPEISCFGPPQLFFFLVAFVQLPVSFENLRQLFIGQLSACVIDLLHRGS